MTVLQITALLACLMMPIPGSAVPTNQNAGTAEKSASVPASDPVPDKDGIYSAGGKVAPPKLIHSVKPAIPKDDRKRMRWGKTTTLIQLTVMTDGTAENTHVIKSSLETMKSKDSEAAAIIDKSCLDAVSQYRFDPALLNGKPVPVLLNVAVDFRIY